MADSKYQLAIIEEARKEGLDPANLSQSQYRRLSFKVRSLEDKVKDTANAVVSRALTSVGLRTVSLEQARSNEDTCRTNKCGYFKMLEGKHPVCTDCNCAGKFLVSKWKDATEACPRGYWNNVGPGQPGIKADGDMVKRG